MNNKKLGITVDEEDENSDDSIRSKLESDSSDSGGDSSSDSEEGDGDEDSHMDECFICDDGGELILCDGEGCNKAYHAKCVNVDINTLPLTWYCPSCTTTSSPPALEPTRKKPSLVDKDTATVTTTTTVKPASNVSKKGRGQEVSDSQKEGDNDSNDNGVNNSGLNTPKQTAGKKKNSTLWDKDKTKSVMKGMTNFGFKPTPPPVGSARKGRNSSAKKTGADDNMNYSRMEQRDDKSDKHVSASATPTPAKASASLEPTNNENSATNDTIIIDKAATTTIIDSDTIADQTTARTTNDTTNDKTKDGPVDTTNDGTAQEEAHRPTFRRQTVRKCVVLDCPNNGKPCQEHGKMKQTCRIPECTNFPQSGGGGVCVKHGAKVKRCSKDGCAHQIVRGGMCTRHYSESLLRDSSSSSSLEELGGGAKGKRCSKDGCAHQIVRGGMCTRHYSELLLRASSSSSSLEELGGDETVPTSPTTSSSKSKKATAAATLPPPEPTFRTVTVPDGVAMGEVFHVLLGKGKVMGVICPEGVHPGDKLITLEPGRHDPPVSPQAIAKMNAQRLLKGVDKSESSFVADAFWKVLWPSLCLEGWEYTRQMNYNFGATTFFPPGAKMMDEAMRILDRHYLETIQSVVSYISKTPKYATHLEGFEAEIAKKKNEKRQNNKKKRRVNVVKKVSDLDAWKYLGEREHIQVGRNYQVRTLPRAGTNVSGEMDEYMINSTSMASDTKTPSAWYDWAKDPNFADQFHRTVMKTKKQMQNLAFALDKPIGFCLWYYYHKYKAPNNHEKYQNLKELMNDLKAQENSDVCAICNDGGDLLCCETCTYSYHLSCLGLTSSDVEGVAKWSCSVCTRKRKLQLSPTKSPKKLRKNDDDSPYSSPDSMSSPRKKLET